MSISTLFSVHYRANRRMTERSDEVSENTSRSAEVNDVSEVCAALRRVARGPFVDHPLFAI
jgi:hypothetical protein